MSRTDNKQLCEAWTHRVLTLSLQCNSCWWDVWSSLWDVSCVINSVNRMQIISTLYLIDKSTKMATYQMLRVEIFFKYLLIFNLMSAASCNRHVYHCVASLSPLCKHLATEENKCFCFKAVFLQPFLMQSKKKNIYEVVWNANIPYLNCP